jgi:SsrA-binding protein
MAIQNRRARFDYEILEVIEAGLVLVGSEVKSLRLGQASINESFAVIRNGELYLQGATISPYKPANRFNHAPDRLRKLLITNKQRENLLGAMGRERLTVVPLEIYFTDKGIAKCRIGLGKGKRKIDKRETIKERDWSRQKSRMLKK